MRYFPMLSSINLWRLNLHTIIDLLLIKLYTFYREMRAYRNNALRMHLPIVQWNINMKYLSSKRNHHTFYSSIPTSCA